MNVSLIFVVSRLALVLYFIYVTTELLFRLAAELKEWGDSAFVLLLVKAFKNGHTYIEFAKEQAQQWNPWG